GMRRMRPVVWPAYAVAAACFAIALITSVYNIGLSQRIRQADSQIVALTTHANALASGSETQKQMVADLMATDSQRFAVTGGEIVKNEGRVYIAMHAAPQPPKGKVYQAWYLRAGAKSMTPSLTFVPDRSGVAVVSIPGNAKVWQAVAVSLEPEGGSKQPTSKPTFVVKLT
ncbi:MAG: anti-sigma factor, partial [Candidatus Eremiobacteraeota bacterium]|nr:anti-sigma factor [Candidatus Eremiobacteraeota bacterium]